MKDLKLDKNNWRVFPLAWLIPVYFLFWGRLGAIIGWPGAVIGLAFCGYVETFVIGIALVKKRISYTQFLVYGMAVPVVIFFTGFAMLCVLAMIQQAVRIL
jgi:hypothetical protein